MPIIHIPNKNRRADLLPADFSFSDYPNVSPGFGDIITTFTVSEVSAQILITCSSTNGDFPIQIKGGSSPTTYTNSLYASNGSVITVKTTAPASSNKTSVHTLVVGQRTKTRYLTTVSNFAWNAFFSGNDGGYVIAGNKITRTSPTGSTSAYCSTKPIPKDGNWYSFEAFTESAGVLKVGTSIGSIADVNISSTYQYGYAVRWDSSINNWRYRCYRNGTLLSAGSPHTSYASQQAYASCIVAPGQVTVTMRIGIAYNTGADVGAIPLFP